MHDGTWGSSGQRNGPARFACWPCTTAVLGESYCIPLVRAQDGHMQLVLLDHGLYKTLSDAFRLEYAGLWRSLILADERGIRQHSEHMNAGGAVKLFTMMLTQRPWEQVDGLGYNMAQGREDKPLRRFCKRLH